MKSYKNIFKKNIKNKTKLNIKKGSSYNSDNNMHASSIKSNIMNVDFPIDPLNYIKSNNSAMAEQPENFINTYIPNIPISNNNSLDGKMLEKDFQKLERMVKDFHSNSIWSHFASRQVLRGAESNTSLLSKLPRNIKKGITTKIGRIPTGVEQKINSEGCTRSSKLEAAESKKQYFLYILRKLPLDLMLLNNKYKFETLDLLKSLPNEILKDIVINQIFILNPHLHLKKNYRIKKKIKDRLTQANSLLNLERCRLNRMPEIFCALRYDTIILQHNPDIVLPKLFYLMRVKVVYLSYNNFDEKYKSELMNKKPENTKYILASL